MLLALLTLALVPADSTARFASCDRPVAPLGVVAARASIAVHVDARGRVSPDSIRVVIADGASQATVLSYLRRMLPSCRVKLERGLDASSGLWFGQELDLTDDDAPRGAVLRVLSAPPALEVPAASDAGAGPTLPTVLPVNHARVEEKPRVVGCDRIAPVRRTVQLPADRFNQAVAQGLPPGRVRLRYIIDADGTVRSSSVAVVQVQGADYSREVSAQVRTCAFAPARVDGQPVAVLVESVESFPP